MKLQILIPTLPERKESFLWLVHELKRQTEDAGYEWGVDVGFIYDPRKRGVATIGEKRNWLLFHEHLTAEYVAFHDDDDRPSPSYIARVLEGIDKGVDCCSLRGIITWNGENPEVFEHSVKYSEWKTNTTGDIKYERFPNHLNVIKREIAQQFRFPESNHGEDFDWSTQVFKSGLIKTEHYIDTVIYNYDYIPNK